MAKEALFEYLCKSAAPHPRSFSIDLIFLVVYIQLANVYFHLKGFTRWPTKVRLWRYMNFLSTTLEIRPRKETPIRIDLSRGSKANLCLSGGFHLGGRGGGGESGACRLKLRGFLTIVFWIRVLVPQQYLSNENTSNVVQQNPHNL